jgi:hypothetical protein
MHQNVKVGDRVVVTKQVPYGGALFLQEGRVIRWDSKWQANPFPDHVRVQFADGYICFLSPDGVKKLCWWQSSRVLLARGAVLCAVFAMAFGMWQFIE